MQEPFSRPRPDGGPIVTPFPDTRQHARFRSVVLDYFAAQQRPVKLLSDLTLLEPGGARHSLWNLAQICRRQPFRRWRELAKDHLDRSNPQRLAAAVQTLADGSYEQSAPRLGVRIHGEGFLDDQTRDAVVFREDLPTTVTLLVLDLGPSVVGLPKPIAERWGVPTERLFEQALRNVASQPVQTHSANLPTHPEVAFDTLTGGHYTTSLCLCERGLPRLGTHGNLLAVGRRDTLVSMPIERLPSMDPIEAMVVLAAALYRTGPGSISHDLFWRAPDGTFQRQRTGQTEAGFHIDMSRDFGLLVQRLRAEDG